MMRAGRTGAVLAVLLTMLLSIAAPTAAAEPDLSTPDAAARSFLEAFAAQDLDRMTAIGASDRQAAGYRFEAYAERRGEIGPYTIPPVSYPLYRDIAHEAFRARLMSQILFLAYSLLTDSPVAAGGSQAVGPGGASAFTEAVDPDGVSRLRVLDSRFPDAGREHADLTIQRASEDAEAYGADESTQRLVLVSLGDDLFEVGFWLLRYGDEWRVAGLSSVLGRNPATGAARRSTQELYDRHTSGDYADLAQ